MLPRPVHVCDVAEGCREAEGKLEAGEYHVVVTDKNMPSGNGPGESGRALIQEKIDIFFDRFKIFERVILYQRERLAEIAAVTGQALDMIPETHPVSPLLIKIMDEAGHRL